MTMPKSITYLFLSILLSCFTFANIDSVEAEVNKNVTSSGSKSTKTTQSSSGYKQDVKVINSQYEFNYRKFESKDFSDWYNLLIQAMSYEHYFKYMEKGSITHRGDVLKPLENGIYPGSKINLNDMVTLAKTKISLLNFYDNLIRKGVLTERGFINKTEFFTGNFEQYDFSFLLDAIKTVELPINDTRLAEELKNELYNYILASSKVLVVNKLETTRYESNKDGFFDNLVDNLAGSFMGNIFYPDKVKTQKSTVGWSSNLDLNQYFGVYYLFNNYPFADGYGFTRLFGKNQMQVLNYSLLQDLEKNLYNDTFSYRSYTAIPAAGKSTPFTGYGISAYQVRNNSDSFQFYNLFGTAGGAFQTGAMHFDLGLSFKRGIPNGLGIYWGYGAEFLLFQPLSFIFEHNGAIQPKYFSNLDSWGSNWSYTQIQTGLKINLGQLALGAGYQWCTGMDGWTAFGSFVF
ncbi:MAG: hypothetical protein PHF25_00835 [Candidatus Margulisbacteria bacterium]|nr:hypothetical protein [Candidatus Margulisiibacteriota bacterium]